MFTKKSKITDLDYILLSGYVYEITDLFMDFYFGDVYNRDFDSFFKQLIKLRDRYVAKLRLMR